MKKYKTIIWLKTSTGFMSMFRKQTNLIIEVMCSNRKQIRIASDDKPIEIVKSSFMKLDTQKREEAQYAENEQKEEA